MEIITVTEGLVVAVVWVQEMDDVARANLIDHGAITGHLFPSRCAFILYVSGIDVAPL